jgi:hypothetical protein
VVPFRFPEDKLDDYFKSMMLTREYKKIKSGWVTIVDADEFVFFDDVNLKELTDDVYYVKLIDVYRHVSESDLDINLSVKEQRRHGALDLSWHEKPIFVKSKLNIERWAIGNHGIMALMGGCNTYTGQLRYLTLGNELENFVLQDSWQYELYGQMTTLKRGVLLGSHWSKADPLLVKERYFKNRNNINGSTNLEYRLSSQFNNIDLDKALAECENMKDSPLMFD